MLDRFPTTQPTPPFAGFYHSALRAPGAKFDIGLRVRLASGRVAATKGLAGGTLAWKNFDVGASGAKVRNGTLEIPMEPVTPGAAIQVHATAKSKPRIEITRQISLNRPTSLSLTPVKPFIKAPGHKFEVALQATYDNGATRPVSPSMLDRFFRVYQLQATPHGGSFKDGMFRIEEDPQRIVRHNVGVALRSTLFPELGTDLNLLLDYVDHYQFQVSGLNGTDGFGGSPGVIGAPGAFGSNGSSGGDGGSGSDASAGGDGHRLEVLADAASDPILNTNLVTVELRDLTSRQTRSWVVNPNGGSIVIVSAGGRGGRGGSGGSGGNGGSGGAGPTHPATTSAGGIDPTNTVQDAGGSGGAGGTGGRGGNGGYAGRGGDIVLRYTRAASPYLGIIDLRAPAGTSGDAGSGGTGGGGGTGGFGSPSGTPGTPGTSGSPGMPGSPANAGTITRVQI